MRVHHRRELSEVERAFRELPGTTAIIYDQTCASEKRRRRKRGTFPDPPRRAFINEAVCEGCGDCSRASNCLSVVPHETEFGTKRQIDQSTCNKDFSCVEGFCPSFVTVHGAKPRRRARVSPDDAGLPEPVLPALDPSWSLLITGVGGTGVVTIGALIGTAAHADGLHVSVLDMAGLAQKGGSVWSHVRIAAAADALQGLHVGAGQADVLLACDMVVAAGHETLAVLRRGQTRVVLNTHEISTADFVLDRDFHLPGARLRRSIVEAAGAPQVDPLDATAIATALLGDAVAANVFMLGYAWQKGLIPLQRESLVAAIELNGTAVEANKAAFAWGRVAAADLPRVLAAAGIGEAPRAPRTLDDLIAARVAHLTAYQNRCYARRYTRLVERVRETEARMFSGSTALTEAVGATMRSCWPTRTRTRSRACIAAPAFRARWPRSSRMSAR